MPKRARFNPVKKPEGWQINVPASMTPGGRRVRRFFDTRDEAREFADKLVIQYKNEGSAAFGLTSDQRVTAARAFALLDEAGVTDLLSVVREGISTLKIRMASKPLGEVFDKYIESRQRSEIYTRSLKRSRRRLGTMMEIPVASVTSEMLEDYLLGAGASYRNSLLREIRAVLNYGVKKGWAPKNPVDQIDFARLHVAEREVYSGQEAGALLGTAATSCPILLPFVAIGLFAGVRVYEMLRLNWNDIDLSEGIIELRAEITKRKRKRFIRVEPALERWLKFALFCGVRMEGDLLPVNTVDALRNQRRTFSSTAGIPWKQNAMRHSYASYWLAEYEDLDKLALQLGHVGGLDVLYRFYHRAVKKAEAKSFWGLTPVEEQGAIVVRDLSKDGSPKVWLGPDEQVNDTPRESSVERSSRKVGDRSSR